LSDELASAEGAWLTQLSENPQYRTHIALTNTRSGAAEPTVTSYDGDGTELASYQVTLQLGEYKQANRPFRSQAGQTDMESGYARIEVTVGGEILASVSVLDNTTNDPTTVPPVL
jgi:hypothetical protein